MSINSKSPEETPVGPEFWHTYASDDKDCPNTWNRELEEWQFDGVTSEGETTHEAEMHGPDPSSDAQSSGLSGAGRSNKLASKRTEAGPRRCGTADLSPMQQELAKWLPAT